MYMRVHPCSKGHILTPALKAIWQIRAECLLQWQDKNRHENILFKDEKIFTIEEQYNHENNKIYAQASLKVRSEGAGRPSPFLHHGLVGGVPSGGDITSFLQERGETGVREYQEDALQGVVKHHNMTLSSGQEWVFQQDSVPTQKAKTTQEWLQRNLLAFISTENWLLASADLKRLHNELWDVLEDMMCRQHHNSLESLKRSPWRWSVLRQQHGRSIPRLVSRHRAAILNDIIINENLKLLQINYLAQKVDVLFNLPSKSHCTCNGTYGKTKYI